MATRRSGKKRKSKTRKHIENYPPGPCQCRPRVGSSRPAYGCLPGSELQRLGHLVLGGSQVGAGNPKSLVKLRNDIAGKLKIDPNNEASFIEAMPIDTKEKQTLKENYLRPKQPEEWKSDPDMWLDSLNIAAVMKQYETDRSDFEFMGPFPIDFAAPDPEGTDKNDCLIDEICDLDLKKLRALGKTKIGIIYNLDPHYKNGSHWVANFIDLNKHRAYYFDSYGMEAPHQIQKFMQFLTLQDPAMKLAYNARRFQFKGSECGMYSMYFIIRMLMGEDFLHFCRRAPRDGAMLYLRNWLFSK
jgi:hypothetical protein